ncbi:MAG: hypothetical protein CMI54_01575 [Parcubacteria group bacterium]|nr:hypothetical protein [Parcubacteria group bacterium]|tara:strand:+ start:29210 stop:29602 length:393 start_codon:yes stop_codon:yes gene_type:complete
MILDIFSKLFGMGEKFIETKQKIKLEGMQAENNLKIKTIDGAASWEEMAAAKSSRFLRWILALHLLALIDTSIYMSLTNHENPSVLFETIEGMPVWCQGLLATVYGFAFGAAPLKAVGAKAFGSLLKRKK